MSPSHATMTYKLHTASELAFLGSYAPDPLTRELAARLEQCCDAPGQLEELEEKHVDLEAELDTAKAQHEELHATLMWLVEVVTDGEVGMLEDALAEAYKALKK